MKTPTKASSFADPADVRAFEACKRKGKSDLECFKVGDNGIGCWGDVTAQTSTPMCALPPQEMERRWGSVEQSRHRWVRVTVTQVGHDSFGKSVRCLLADRMPRKTNKSGAGIDLNPAASEALGLTPPHLIEVVWEWV